jgi:DNA polymerase III alpha subunit
MLFEYDIISELTSKEIEKCKDILKNNKTISSIDLLKSLLNAPKINIKRKATIENLISGLIKPPYSVIDRIEWLSDSENNLLGASITCFKIDTYDTGMANCNCKTFKTCHINNNVIIAGEINNVNIIKTKKGKNPGQEMAFLSIEDQYGMLDSVIFFPEQLSKYRNYLYDGNILIFAGNRSKTKDGLVVDKCYVPIS